MAGQTPIPHLSGAPGMAAMLAPPDVLLTRTVVIACLAGGVCAAGMFGSMAFGAGFAAMGAGGAAVASGAAAQGAMTMFGAMFPASAIAYYTSARAQPPDEDDVVATNFGLPGISQPGGASFVPMHHHHVEEHEPFENKEILAEREVEPVEYREPAYEYRELA